MSFTKVFPLLLLLTACSLTTEERRAQVTHDIQRHHCIAKTFRTENGSLFGAVSQNISRTPTYIPIFIEGDGYAWVSYHQPSSDPTPHSPHALKMMLASTATYPSLYLARPCQYVRFSSCRVGLWTSERFSSFVMRQYASVFDELKETYPRARFILVGYSGGGVLALLLAQAHPEVAGVITVASPIDLSAWVSHHGISPLRGSLDPLQASPEAFARLRTLPQLHLSAADDDVVPPSVFTAYQRKLGKNPSITFKTLPGFSHSDAFETVIAKELQGFINGLPKLS